MANWSSPGQVGVPSGLEGRPALALCRPLSPPAPAGCTPALRCDAYSKGERRVAARSSDAYCKGIECRGETKLAVPQVPERMHMQAPLPGWPGRRAGKKGGAGGARGAREPMCDGCKKDAVPARGAGQARRQGVGGTGMGAACLGLGRQGTPYRVPRVEGQVYSQQNKQAGRAKKTSKLAAPTWYSVWWGCSVPSRTSSVVRLAWNPDSTRGPDLAARAAAAQQGAAGSRVN